MDDINLVSAAVYIFVNINGKWNILIGKRAGNSYSHQGGYYNVPVGMREYGESSEENAIRECYEETGIVLNPSQLKYAGYEEWGYGKAGANYVVILDNADKYSIGDGDWENERFFWCPIDEISQYNFAYGMDRTAMSLFKQYVGRSLNEQQLHRIIRRVLNEIMYR